MGEFDVPCTTCGHDHLISVRCLVHVQRGEYEGPCLCGGKGSVVDIETDPHYKRRKAHGKEVS